MELLTLQKVCIYFKKVGHHKKYCHCLKAQRIYVRLSKLDFDLLSKQRRGVLMFTMMTGSDEWTVAMLTSMMTVEMTQL